VKVGGVVRATVVASAALAAVTVLIASVGGHLSVGLGLGAGLLIGSLNGRLVAGTLDMGAPFVAMSLVRMAVVSALAILAAVLLGISPWAVLIGVGAAQLVMVAAGIRQGLRA
jgi:hypothetical protein